MLPKENRLRRSADFQVVKQNGRRWRSGPITANVAPNALTCTRFGFIVPKRIGSAVVRNQVKRRLRAIVHQHLTLINEGYDVVVITYPPAETLAFSELEALLTTTLSKASVLEYSS